jgi:hypothetical protein
MKSSAIGRLLSIVIAVVLAGAMTSSPVGAQRGRPPEGASRPRANQGHVPSAPPGRDGRHEEEHHPSGHVSDIPHVNHDHWYGHPLSGDARFHLDRPFEHGRFARLGPSFRYRVMRVDRDRHMFWFPGGFFFEIAAWDWPLFADWCWDCGDDFVVYDDPGHPGWYLIYNVHLGEFVHAMYMGTS